jgi:hypothetical protein
VRFHQRVEGASRLARGEVLKYFTERRGELASIIRRSTNAEERHATEKQLLELISSKAWLPYDRNYFWSHMMLRESNGQQTHTR